MAAATLNGVSKFESSLAVLPGKSKYRFKVSSE
jgi:hypothetical protein